MVLVDGDVTSDVADSYMMWIACMLRKIELMTLSGVHLYSLYRYVAANLINGKCSHWSKRKYIKCTIFESINRDDITYCQEYDDQVVHSETTVGPAITSQEHIPLKLTQDM